MSIFSDLFHKIGNFIHNTFTKAQHAAADAVPKAIELVNAIKTFDSTLPLVGDALTALIPGDWDDKLKEIARAKLPEILAELKIVDAAAHADNVDDFIKAALDELNKFAPKIRGVYWHSIAILLADAFADGKISISEITAIMQAVYDLQHKAAA